VYDYPNLYEYVRSQPANSVDPSGLKNLRYTPIDLAIPEIAVNIGKLTNVGISGSIKGKLWASELCCPKDCPVEKNRGKWLTHYTIDALVSVKASKTLSPADLPGGFGLAAAFIMEQLDQTAEVFTSLEGKMALKANWDACNERVKLVNAEGIIVFRAGGRLNLGGTVTTEGHWGYPLELSYDSSYGVRLQNREKKVWYPGHTYFGHIIEFRKSNVKNRHPSGDGSSEARMRERNLCCERRTLRVLA